MIREIAVLTMVVASFAPARQGPGERQTCGQDYARDVDCMLIVAPTGTVDSGTVVTPRAWVCNFGASVDSINVKFDIGTVYTWTMSVPYLAAGDSVQVTFSDWTAAPTGYYLVRCSTQLAGDSNPSNDRRIDSVRVAAPSALDVGVTQIVAPTGAVLPLSGVTPTAVWRNNGAGVAAFTGWFSIFAPNMSRVYSQSLTVSALASGRDTTLVFPSFGLDSAEGRWQTRCSTSCAGDVNAANDTLTGYFLVEAPPPWPDTWDPGEPVPTGGGRPVKDGGWLVVPPGLTDGLHYIFAAKGNKTDEFYRYTVATGIWTLAARIPLGREGKLPGKGCKAVADSSGFVYMTKGNNTQGFWRYNSATDAWTQLADVPLGSSNKKVKSGDDLAYIQIDGGRYIYLVKGQKTNEFWRYNISGDNWLPLEAVPADLPALKTEAGSWLELVETAATDGQPFLYLHKAKYHHLHRYDLNTGKWMPGRKTGMPFIGKSGKSKKSKDGGCAAQWAGDIYALKGGNTCEFWKYLPATDQWRELPSIPEIEPDGKKKRVKGGADIVALGGGGFFVFKGNKTNVPYRVVVAESRRDGATAREFSVTAPEHFGIVPNPLRAGYATLSLPSSIGRCRLSVHDANGRCVLRRALDTGHRASGVTLDLRSEPAGVYVVRLDAEGYTTQLKLVLGR